MLRKLVSLLSSESDREADSTDFSKDNDTAIDSPTSETAPEEKSATQRARESDILIDPELLEGMVNTDRRAEIIVNHYEVVGQSEAEMIADLLKTNMEGYELKKHEAKKQIREETSLDRNQVETIWWTERQSIQTLNSLNEESSLDMEYSWSTAGDDAVHPVCEAVSEEIEQRGGSVPLKELKSILRNKAEKLEDDGGTPERVDHLVVHEKCRSAILPKPK